MGYYRAGFEVVGVDINPQPNYPFEFHQADAMTFPLDGFDAIHASPPCQAFTTMSNRSRGQHPDFIDQVRERIKHLPYVLENVEGAARKLRSPIRLHGRMFGLGVYRPRLFECSFFMLTAPDTRRVDNAVGVYGKIDGRRVWTRADGTEQRAAKTIQEARDAMGIDWMDKLEITQAIPPVYTEYIGSRLMEYLNG